MISLLWYVYVNNIRGKSHQEHSGCHQLRRQIIPPVQSHLLVCYPAKAEPVTLMSSIMG